MEGMSESVQEVMRGRAGCAHEMVVCDLEGMTCGECPYMKCNCYELSLDRKFCRKCGKVDDGDGADKRSKE